MNLRDMISSRAYDAFIGDRLGNDLFISDPDRADRLHAYAADGVDGSLHAEVIQDWRDFLDTLRDIDPDYPEDGGDITAADRNGIIAEIDDCEERHEKAGTLYEIVG